MAARAAVTATTAAVGLETQTPLEPHRYFFYKLITVFLPVLNNNLGLNYRNTTTRTAAAAGTAGTTAAAAVGLETQTRLEPLRYVFFKFITVFFLLLLNNNLGLSYRNTMTRTTNGHDGNNGRAREGRARDLTHLEMEGNDDEKGPTWHIGVIWALGVFRMFVTTSASCTTDPPSIHLHIPICGSDDAHQGPRMPTKVNAGPQHPMKVNEGPQQPTKGNDGQVLALVRLLRDLVVFHVYNNSFFVFVL